MLPLKHQNWVRKEFEDSEKARIIHWSLFPYASSIVIVPRKCAQGSSIQQTNRLCVDYWKLKSQLPTMLGNKSSGAVALADIPKLNEMLAQLWPSQFVTSLDIRHGCYHIKIGTETGHTSAFTTIFGKYEFQGMPFRLAQGSYFTPLMQKVLGTLNYFCFFHMDDVTVYD